MTDGCTADCWSDRDRQLWLANKKLRQVEIVCRVAVDAVRVRAALVGEPALAADIAILTMARTAKNRCDAIKTELLPWVERRGVTLVMER